MRFRFVTVVLLACLPQVGTAAALEGIVKVLAAREQRAQRDAQQCDGAQARAEQTLHQAEAAVRTALASKDRGAEATAREAVTLSRDNRNILRELCAEAAYDLKRARKSLALARRLQSGSADQPIAAAVIEQRGRLERSDAGGAWTALTADSAAPLRSGDRLRTGANGGAEFLLQDGATAAQLGPDSELQLTLDDYGNAAVDLTRGAFYAAVAPLRMRMKRLEVRTGGGSGAVRGTRFAVRQDGDNTEFLVIEGEVAVMPRGAEQAVAVRAGQRLLLRPDTPAPTPSAIDWDITPRWWREEAEE